MTFKAILRTVLLLILLTYIFYIAWPGIEALLQGALGAAIDSGRRVVHGARWVQQSAPQDLVGMARQSLQGTASVEAIERADWRVIGLWVVVIGLYLISAYMFSKGQWRAMLAYLAAFGADIALSILGAGGDPNTTTPGGLIGGFAGKLVDAFARGDYRFLVLGGALFIGLTLLASARPDKKEFKRLRLA